MYNVNYGIFNALLMRLGLPKLEWIYSPKTALMSVMLVYLWQTIPFNMVIYLAALQTVPAQLYEAAQVDGASFWTQFYKITLPIIMPATYFIIIISGINALNVFVQIYLMTSGGPLGSTTMIGYQIYEAAFEFNMWGRGSAIAVMSFLLILCLSFVQYKYIPESYV
jgi:ABC-type sugar transport system permease subunit